MNQPEPISFIPSWARKTAEVKFLKIFTLSFESEWRNNCEHKHFIDVIMFNRWKIVSIETRTGIRNGVINNYLPRIYKPKRFLSKYNKDLTDKFDTFNETQKFYKDKVTDIKFEVSDSEFISEFEYSVD